MAYSMVFLDLDGTLLDSRKQVSPNTGAFLRNLERKKQVPVVLCSAHSPEGVELVAREVGLSGPIICYNGGLILGAQREIMDERGIDPLLAVDFKRHAARRFPGVVVSAYLYNIWLVDDPEAPAIMEEAAITQCQPLRGDLARAAQTASIHKLLCIGPAQQITRLREECEEQFPDLELVQSSPTYLEVMAEKTSKRAAVKKLAEHYHVNPKNIVACGDYFADIGMLEYAGIGIAMGNAPEAVKKRADRVTTSNDEEGVYIALKTLRFISPEKNQ